MFGREIKRKLEIDEAKILTATAAKRGTEPIKRLGATGLYGLHQRRQFPALLESF